ncbi:hypothetical protein [Pseudomonas sp. HTZ1]|uniref:hypothetical protein n=1 Tax=Pseudomonas sp. HTZ1 TaxID=3075219 RepID=UPI00287C1559|nr:hypothetical protein [Pseudomonas sp. HTZ1]MDS9590708.1 hypothetical protein [Pseudomonas sp. HTZ1]
MQNQMHQFDIDSMKESFFSSGGKIIVLEGFTYRPLPQRKHPEPKPKRAKPAAHKSEHPQQSRARTRAARIAELAKTMTCGEVAKLLGETKGALWGVAAREGFRFCKPPRQAQPVKDAAAQEAADRQLADRIIALRDEGMSRCRATAVLGIGNRKLERILAAFKISFPLQRCRG